MCHRTAKRTLNGVQKFLTDVLPKERPLLDAPLRCQSVRHPHGKAHDDPVRRLQDYPGRVDAHEVVSGVSDETKGFWNYLRKNVLWFIRKNLRTFVPYTF